MEVLLDWTHPVKVGRARALALSLQSHGVDSVAELATWWEAPLSQAILMNIRGIGPKTAEYIGILAGAPSAVAVDVHLSAFVAEQAEMIFPDSLAKDTIGRAADILGIGPSSLDGALWK